MNEEIITIDWGDIPTFSACAFDIAKLDNDGEYKTILNQYNDLLPNACKLNIMSNLYTYAFFNQPSLSIYMCLYNLFQIQKIYLVKLLMLNKHYYPMKK
jgi:hypothetical protein